tara:strand:- start:368 stop:1252 length:885 start_codon:yes stop_codon:yes gene_type:complete
MALDGYGANYVSAPQGWNENAKRDVDINKDGRPNNEEGQNRYQNFLRGANANFDIFNNFISRSKDNFINDEGENTGLQNNALLGSMFGAEYASNLANRDADRAAGRAMGVGEFFNIMNANDKSRDRFEQSQYGKDFMAFSADIQNQFANQDFDRGMRALGATSEQARKNLYAAADAGNMGRVVQGEQDRQLVLAESDRDVRSTQAEGIEQRRGYETLGKETRETTRTKGKEDRALEMVRSDRDIRKAGALGFQERLNEETRGKQARRTIDFSDRIDARKEGRQSKRASNLARSF